MRVAREPRSLLPGAAYHPLEKKIQIQYAYPDLILGCWVYVDRCVDANTREVVSDGVTFAPMDGNGTTLYSWSSDSEMWSRWVWSADHYDEVGGSEHVRSYWPAR